MVLTSLWAQLLVAGTVHSRRPLFQSGFVMNGGEYCYGASARSALRAEARCVAFCGSAFMSFLREG